MLYISDFYKHGKEAVSNQLDTLLDEYKTGYLLAPSVFMSQRVLHKDDLDRNRIILSEENYYKILESVVNNYKDGIHYFEEGKEYGKEEMFNKSDSNLYISLFRKPDDQVAEHLLRYKNLKKVFVESLVDYEFLINSGINKSKVSVYHTPTIFNADYIENNRKKIKEYNDTNIHILFASWNGGDEESLKKRGLIYLIKLLKENQNTTLHILARDHDTRLFLEKIHLNGIEKRVKIYYDIDTTDELFKIYQIIDIVAFCTIEKVTKDVPNSIVDGLVLSKPCIITNQVSFSDYICENELGCVIHDFNTVPQIGEIFNTDNYNKYVTNITKIQDKFTLEKYKGIVYEYEK